MNDFFSERVAPYLDDLRVHCLNRTGSVWEADDLIQETLIRVHRALDQQPDRRLSKAFMRRIADHVWIDRYRKNKTTPVTRLEPDSDIATADRQLDVREALEQLSDRLNARQMTLVLLVDLFRFTAKEAAELIRSTEGAVKEGLKRARRKLHPPGLERSETVQTRSEPAAQPPVTVDLFESFLHGFRTANPYAIARAYLSLTDSGVAVMDITRSEQILAFTFCDLDGHLIRVSANFLPSDVGDRRSGGQQGSFFTL